MSDRVSHADAEARDAYAGHAHTDGRTDGDTDDGAAHTYADGHAHGNADPNGDADACAAHTDAHGHAYVGAADAHSDRNVNADANTDADRDADTDTDSHSNGDRNRTGPLTHPAESIAPATLSRKLPARSFYREAPVVPECGAMSTCVSSAPTVPDAGLLLTPVTSTAMTVDRWCDASSEATRPESCNRHIRTKLTRYLLVFTNAAGAHGKQGPRQCRAPSCSL